MDSIRCAIADDHAVVRDGVRLRLESAEGIEVVGMAEDGPSALTMLRDTTPDVAIIDLRLPGLDGIEVVSQARAEGLTTRIVILSAHATHPLVERAIASGALGYMSKETDTELLVAAVRSAYKGRHYIDPLIAAEAYGGDHRPSLSTREREVLQKMAEGKQNMAIAFELEISADTVKTHVSHILSKLESDSRAHAVANAFRMSLVV